VSGAVRAFRRSNRSVPCATWPPGPASARRTRLHDGAQQRLAAVSNLLRVVQGKLDRGDAAVDVLRLASDELGAAQVELRDLARGLHPVALSERGLRSALESLKVGYEVPVTLDVPEDRLREDLELAAAAAYDRHEELAGGRT
jgi:signal transduction histidine kinase